MFLLRHTRTTWNDLSRYQGRIDTELSPDGLEQVQQIAGLVKLHDFEVVYSSPLKRARILASAMAERAQVPLIIDERMTEIAMGPWEGLRRHEIQEQFGDMLDRWHDHPDGVQFPGGENLDDVAERVGAFMDAIFKDRLRNRIAVISHDAVVKVALMLSLGLELRHLHRFRMRNGSVSVLKGSSYIGSVDAIDCTSHLTGSPFRVPS